MASSRAKADVLGRALAAVAAVDDQPGGGTSPPPQPADLTAWAGEARATTLPELLQIAVRQAPNLQSAKLDIAIAEARIQETWARNDWLFQAKLTGSHTTGANTGTVTSVGVSGEVSRLLPTGGTVALHADSTYAKTTGSFQALFDGTSWTNNLAASITQPLLRGRGRALFEANEVRATFARDALVLARQLAAIQTVQAVIAAYWDLVLAEKTVAITQASLDLARERLRITQIGAEGGKVPRSEIPAVLQIIATREEDVLNGELTVLDRSIGLRRAAGMPIGAGELGLRVATDLETQDRPLDLGQLVERAYTASPELAQLATQDRSATIDIEVTENGLLPQLDAALSLGPTGSARTFGQSWKDLAELNALAIAGSLTFSRSLDQNDVRGRVREQHEIKRKLMVSAFDVRAQIAQTMSQAVAQLELARRRVMLSQRAIDLANENIKIETDRFNLGKSTNFDVLNRLEELRQAELRKAQALIDWHKAEVVIQALTGELLPAYGIALDQAALTPAR
ncbi:MAG TPA: TolC family protein [Kofleriaceae bacterium]|nr:TolC family protein [Kofleriaceae bacterium]